MYRLRHRIQTLQTCNVDVTQALQHDKYHCIPDKLHSCLLLIFTMLGFTTIQGFILYHFGFERCIDLKQNPMSSVLGLLNYKGYGLLFHNAIITHSGSYVNQITLQIDRVFWVVFDYFR